MNYQNKKIAKLNPPRGSPHYLTILLAHPPLLAIVRSLPPLDRILPRRITNQKPPKNIQQKNHITQQQLTNHLTTTH